MRRQYHFQPSPQGRLAWDVHRLVALSADLPIVDVELAQLEPLLDTVHWFDSANPPTVRRVLEHLQLIEEADPTFPILLGADGRLMDGMHRICKAFASGHRTIAARQFTVDPDPDHVGVEPQDLPYD